MKTILLKIQQSNLGVMKLVGEETSLIVHPHNLARLKEETSDRHFYGKNDLKEVELKEYTEERLNDEDPNTVFMIPPYINDTRVSTFQVGDTRYLMPNTTIMDYSFSVRDDITPIIQEFMLGLFNEVDEVSLTDHRERTIRDAITSIVGKKDIRVGALYFFTFKNKVLSDMFNVFIKNPLRFVSKGVASKLLSHAGDIPLFDEAALAGLRSNTLTYPGLISNPSLLLGRLSKEYMPEAGNVYYLRLFLDLQKSYGSFNYYVRSEYDSSNSMGDYSNDIDYIVSNQRGRGHESKMEELDRKSVA